MPDTVHFTCLTPMVVHQPAIRPIAPMARNMCGFSRSLPAMLPRSNLPSGICQRMERDLPLFSEEIEMKAKENTHPFHATTHPVELLHYV
ncbi:hypothetical protein Y032_0435g1405 [Ancylostoma ceylanicum]|uniref:Uncharacterized protein n=1 Tax=Ancylostoma ceylanicum TaxID=53326 RepID=A0A016X1S2_9BILA|nr:hypothetical protein Y032_0435g1405 [Ancylostoma ceylanicum]